MSQSKVIHLNDKSIDKIIKNSKIIMIDFWAKWCGPCKMISSIVDGLSNKVEDGIVIAKVDVDDAPISCADFAISSVPTFLFFKDGEEVDRRSGMIGEQSLLDTINRLNSQ
jgi:thioredoxin 1